jgi:hypothetical protein
MVILLALEALSNDGGGWPGWWPGWPSDQPEG